MTLTIEQRLAVISRRNEEPVARLRQQLLQKQSGYCALVGGLYMLDGDHMSWLPLCNAFVMPLVATMVKSFGDAPTANVVSAILQFDPDEDVSLYRAQHMKNRSRTLVYLSNLTDTNIFYIYAQRLVEQNGRCVHGFNSSTVQQPAPLGLLKAPFVCAHTGIELTAERLDPTSAVYYEGEIVSAMWWIVHSLKGLCDQMAALQMWARTHCLGDGDSKMPWRDYVCAATRR